MKISDDESKSQMGMFSDHYDDSFFADGQGNKLISDKKSSIDHKKAALTITSDNQVKKSHNDDYSADAFDDNYDDDFGANDKKSNPLSLKEKSVSGGDLAAKSDLN